MNYLRLAAAFLFTAVILGAFGAHTLENYIDARQQHSWHTAVEYQFYHGLGIMLLNVIPPRFVTNQKRLNLASLFLALGVFLFSGSIYLLSTRDITGLPTTFLGPITPIGGLCFLMGWLLCFLSFGKSKAIDQAQ